MLKSLLLIFQTLKIFLVKEIINTTFLPHQCPLPGSQILLCTKASKVNKGEKNQIIIVKKPLLPQKSEKKKHFGLLMEDSHRKLTFVTSAGTWIPIISSLSFMSSIFRV